MYECRCSWSPEEEEDIGFHVARVPDSCVFPGMGARN